MTTVRTSPLSGDMAHPVAQARGRATVGRLLDAAERLLGEAGLDGTTVPAIAERAGVAVGTVYKRFPDKDALLRAVYLRFFERARSGNREMLDSRRWQEAPVARVLDELVRGMVEGYRRQPELFRALHAYADTHADPEFRRQVEAFREETLRGFVRLLEVRAAELAHPRPAEAVRFVVTVITLTLRSLVAPGVKGRSRQAGSLLNSEAAVGELVAMVQAYLLSQPGPPAPAAARRSGVARTRRKRQG